MLYILFEIVPSGTKPLPEPMLTQVYIAIWRHLARMSQVERTMSSTPT